MKSPFLALGAYSFRTLYKIDKKMKGYKREGLYDFICLQKNCNILLKQIKTYPYMMSILGIAEKGTEYNYSLPRAEYIRQVAAVLLRDPKLSEDAGARIRALLAAEPLDELRATREQVEEAARIAVREVKRFLSPAESAEVAEDMEVIFCCFSERDANVYRSLIA